MTDQYAEFNAPTIIVQPKPRAFKNTFAFYPQNECAKQLASVAGTKTLTLATLQSAEKMGLALELEFFGQTHRTTYEALTKLYPETN